MNIIIAIGLLICVACIVINRFVVEIPSKIAIPVYIIGITCEIVGLILAKRNGAI